MANIKIRWLKNTIQEADAACPIVLEKCKAAGQTLPHKTNMPATHETYRRVQCHSMKQKSQARIRSTENDIERQHYVLWLRQHLSSITRSCVVCCAFQCVSFMPPSLKLQYSKKPSYWTAFGLDCHLFGTDRIFDCASEQFSKTREVNTPFSATRDSSPS